MTTSGHFGEVFLGTWNGVDVALKKLVNAGMVKEFAQEAKTLQ